MLASTNMPEPNHLHETTAQRVGFRWLSAPGAAALSILFVTGAGSAFRGALRNAADEPRLAWLTGRDGTRLDQVMYARHADGVLVTCHGGASVRAAIERELIGQGLARLPAEAPFPGSTFRRRTLNLLASARGPAAVCLVLDAAGEEAALADALGNPESIPALLDVTAGARFLFEPPRVQLWGPVNAGKSSLLNALCGRAFAATGDEAGLTRDVIEGRLRHRGHELRLFDAPGIGAGGPLDAEAVELAERWRREADLTVELVPPGGKAAGTGDWLIASRADEGTDAPGSPVSIHDPESLEALKDRMVGHFFTPLAALPPGRRFAILPALRDDLRALAEDRADAGELRRRWLA